MTKINGPFTETQQALYDEYKNVVKDKVIVRQNVVQNDINTLVGDFTTGNLDIADIAEFDKAGVGGASSSGALIHETVEQLEKAKLGLLPKEYSKTVKTTEISPEFTSSHETATKAENKVNGNIREEDDGYFLEKDGAKTNQVVRGTPSGGIVVEKTKIKE